MQRARLTRPVVPIKFADAVHNIFYFAFSHFDLRQIHFLVNKTGCWHTPQIEDNFNQIRVIILIYQGLADLQGEDFQ